MERDTDPRQRLPRSRRRTLAAAALLLAAWAGAASAQTRQTELEPLNYAFAAYVGSGIYSSSSQTAWLVRIPVSVPVLPSEERAFGLRVRLRTTLGFFNFDPANLLERQLPDSVGTFSMLAGVDFPVRVRANWTLAPFADLGPAWDNDTQKWSGVAGIGAWSRAEFPLARERAFVLSNELVRASNFGGEEFEEKGFGKFQTELELRLPLRAAIGGKRLAVGPFVQGAWLFDPLEIGGVIDDPKPIRWRYEVGVKLGPESKEKIHGVPLPRLGLGYRFGQGVTSVRFIFSTRY